MNTTTVEETSFSTIVTPPDFISSPKLFTFTLIDTGWREIEDLALYLKTAKDAYTVYVYRAEMNNMSWLEEAISKSSSVIINTEVNGLSPYKDKLAIAEIAWHYGEKKFLMSMARRIEKPIEFFVRLSNPA